MKQKKEFIGREEELKALSKLYHKKTASLVTIQGRRRIGKSRLVEEFAKGQYFLRFSGLAPEEGVTAQDQRNEFARHMSEQLGIPRLQTADWGDLFTLLAKQITKGRVVILFDEISWMANKDKTFLGKLKNIWDMHLSKNPKLILILCGSVSYWIEKNILSGTGFLGRVSLNLSLDELSLQKSVLLLRQFGFKKSPMELFMILSLTGGVPWYLELINPGYPANENIKDLCFTQGGILVREFKNIFHDLFGPRSGIYQEMVQALSKQSLEYKELAHRIGYRSSGPLSEYLEDLVLAGFINRDYSWSFKSGKISRLSKYRIRDNYLRFYLRYIEPNLQKINKGRYKFSSLASLPAWNTMLGLQFENLVLNNRLLILQELGIQLEDIVADNPFSQRKSSRVKACQIDYLVQTKQKTFYACEIKFSQQEITTQAVDDMKEKLQKLKTPAGFSVCPVLIHVNGVQDAVEDSEYFLRIINFTKFLD